MGTKNNPAPHDCYTNALPDEPMFTLLARDPDFARLVRLWADRREDDICSGERPIGDMTMVNEARDCAVVGQDWRRKNMGAWRSTTP